jgi:hypothetical protein
MMVRSGSALGHQHHGFFGTEQGIQLRLMIPTNPENTMVDVR